MCSIDDSVCSEIGGLANVAEILFVRMDRMEKQISQLAVLAALDQSKMEAQACSEASYKAGGRHQSQLFASPRVR